MSNKIKSVDCKEKAYVRFVNKSGRSADIVWLDFEGAPVYYHTLLPDSHVDVDTFTTHPWLFEDHHTKDRLVVNNEEYFFAPSWSWILRRNGRQVPAQVQPHRFIVMITLPVYSLRERCLQVVRDKADPMQLVQLEEFLPKTVIDDLFKCVLKKHNIL